MNRREAIQHVIELHHYMVDGMVMAGVNAEFDTRAALRALGVTDAEIDEAEKG